jgi:hypothetical protein
MSSRDRKWADGSSLVDSSRLPLIVFESENNDCRQANGRQVRRWLRLGGGMKWRGGAGSIEIARNRLRMLTIISSSLYETHAKASRNNLLGQKSGVHNDM